MHRFWNFMQSKDGERILRLEGPIADETWWGDEITPREFKRELLAGSGDVAVWINSPGGDCFAAAEIYTALKEYPGKITMKIDALAASAASVVAMAGDEILMSPASNMMIHNPATIAIGDGEEMARAKAMLDEIKESIIGAYELKTGNPRIKISHWMDAESWMSAHKAVELGFADGILYTENRVDDNLNSVIFSRAAVTNSILDRIQAQKFNKKSSMDSLEKRLSLISH